MEKFLIRHCSPALAGRKLANIFSIDKYNTSLIEIVKWIIKLRPYGIGLKVFKRNTDKLLIYVYNIDLFKDLLEEEDIRTFLHTYNYKSFSIKEVFENLQDRLYGQEEFPHEIGIFLGYPTSDVIGFIENNGKNCKRIGKWKVYGNVEECELFFKECQRCESYFINQYNKGKSISSIIRNFKGDDYEENSGSLLEPDWQY